jgi:hypothetical protein
MCFFSSFFPTHSLSVLALDNENIFGLVINTDWVSTFIPLKVRQGIQHSLPDVGNKDSKKPEDK